jgi:hypothetical protein
MKSVETVRLATVITLNWSISKGTYLADIPRTNESEFDVCWKLQKKYLIRIRTNRIVLSEAHIDINLPYIFGNQIYLYTFPVLNGRFRLCFIAMGFEYFGMVIIIFR